MISGFSRETARDTCWPSRALGRAIDGCVLARHPLGSELPAGHPSWAASEATIRDHFAGQPDDLVLCLVWRAFWRMKETLGTPDFPAEIDAAVALVDCLRGLLDRGHPARSARLGEGLRGCGGEPCRQWRLWLAWSVLEQLAWARMTEVTFPPGSMA